MRNGKFSDADFQQNLSIVSNIDLFLHSEYIGIIYRAIGNNLPPQEALFQSA